jgi:two-component system cell cycle sensor histidine kinase/response regulator CckA
MNALCLDLDPPRAERLRRTFETMESATEQVHRNAAPQVTKTILLVEDDIEVREITRAILRNFGYIVLTAESECQALWLWERHQLEIELLISDMMIPNCATGLDLAKKLRTQKPGLKVLITSGFSREIGGEDTAFLKRTPFLQKPYSAQALLESVNRCLQGAHAAAVTPG